MIKKDIKLPVKINPCPIKQAIIEIRFESDCYFDAVFGLIYKDFKEEISKTPTELPIVQFPLVMRQKENLKYQPYYRLNLNNGYLFMIGARVFSLVREKEYSGWNDFVNVFIKCFEKIKKTGLIKEVSRIGIRYVNEFTDNIFDNIDLSVIYNGEALKNKKLNIQTEFEYEKYNNLLRISDNNIGKSYMDIDVSLSEGLEINKVLDLVIKSHLIEKQIFYSLLKPNYLKGLNPEYE